MVSMEPGAGNSRDALPHDGSGRRENALRTLGYLTYSGFVRVQYPLKS